MTFGLRNKISVIKYLSQFVFHDSSNSPAEKRLKLFWSKDTIDPSL